MDSLAYCSFSLISHRLKEGRPGNGIKSKPGSSLLVISSYGLLYHFILVKKGLSITSQIFQLTPGGKKMLRGLAIVPSTTELLSIFLLIPPSGSWQKSFVM
jgi:hypothetical protein